MPSPEEPVTRSAPSEAAPATEPSPGPDAQADDHTDDHTDDPTDGHGDGHRDAQVDTADGEATDAAPAAPAPPRVGAKVDADGFVRIHPNRMSLLALLVALLCGSPFLAAGLPWSLLVLLVPAALAWYVLRTGTVASSDGVALRGPTYSRTVLRDEIDGLAVTAGNGVALLRRGGTTLLLPAARPRDLPALREVLFEAERAAP